MKKFLILLICLIVLISLCACRASMPVNTIEDDTTSTYTSSTENTASQSPAEETLSNSQPTEDSTIPKETSPSSQETSKAPINQQNKPSNSQNQSSGSGTMQQEDLLASGDCIATSGKWKITKDGTLTIYGKDRPEDKSSYTWGPYADQVKKIVVDDGITHIPERAFYCFKNVTEVVLADTVETIGSEAFSNCYALSKIVIPHKVKELCQGTFTGCTSLTTLSFAPNSQLTTLQSYFGSAGLKKFVAPPNLTTICHHAFAGSSNLEEVILDNGKDLTVDNYAFDECRSLKKLVLGDKIERIASNAFSSCFSLSHYESYCAINIELQSYTQLKTVIIGGNVTKIPSFSGCTSLQDVKITSPITSIKSGQFMGCSSLKVLSIPNTVTTIEKYAFVNSGIQTLTIPASVKELGICLFNKTALETIVFVGDPPVFESNITDGTFSGLGKLIAYYPANNPRWTQEMLQNHGATEVIWISQ